MNLSPSSDLVMAILAAIGAGSILVGLVSWLVILTIGFRKAIEVEKIVGPEGSGIHGNVWTWGTHPLGRMVRTVGLWSFFFWRKVPGYGVWVASKLGDIHAEVPWRLRGWVVVPLSVVWLSGILLFLCWGMMRWIETGSVLN